MLTDPVGTNVLTRAIIGCGIRVHSFIGPGVYESVYAECLEYELKLKGLSYEAGRAVPIVYRGVRLKSRFYVDLVVEDCVVIELKAVPVLAEIHRRQVLTHLRLTGLPVGLLMNFNVVTLTDGGVKRIVNPDLGKSDVVAGETTLEGRTDSRADD
jgi:GxxExxY protein